MVKMASPFGVIVSVPAHRVRMSQPTKEIGDLSVSFRANNKMPVIGHHAVSENSKINAFMGKCQNAFKCLVVSLLASQKESNEPPRG